MIDCAVVWEISICFVSLIQTFSFVSGTFHWP
jgi:hypothetical protein